MNTYKYFLFPARALSTEGGGKGSRLYTALDLVKINEDQMARGSNLNQRETWVPTCHSCKRALNLTQRD
jgi:hypothetical protein